MDKYRRQLAQEKRGINAENQFLGRISDQLFGGFDMKKALQLSDELQTFKANGGNLSPRVTSRWRRLEGKIQRLAGL